MVCMSGLLPLNGRISSNFDNNRLELSAHAYFMVLFHSMWTKYKNSNNIVL